MSDVSVIGIDLAKQVFQLHGARSDGSVVFRKKLSRAELMPFLADHPRCIVAMEACATAHGWGRDIGQLGHDVRLIPPQYVKPFVKRQKNDKADAEAITEAAARPTMQFVEIKTEDQQARAMLFRSRQMLISQRTQTINALRGHLAEYGVVAPKSKAGLNKLLALVSDEESNLPTLVRSTTQMYREHINDLSEKITDLTATIPNAPGNPNFPLGYPFSFHHLIRKPVPTFRGDGVYEKGSEILR
jgi:transposase